jgi:uncharacterized protein (TIGR03437 family)
MATWRLSFAACLLASLAPGLGAAAVPRVLYVTATYGFRHDSIPASIQVLQDLANESGLFEVVNTEDVSLLNAGYLRDFDAVYFFTSGELPLSDQQKADLLEFVLQGKGFGGSHSATDTLYTWPEYGDMIGGYFDGHPWTQEANVDVEDPDDPMVKHMAPSFRTQEEFYQFRSFSRDNVRVLLTLDTRSVDLRADGVNRTDGDFALAWIRRYGQGRVFYSAFGHFDDSFRLPVLRTMLLNALLWLTGQIDADATPRSGSSSAAPSLTREGVNNLGAPNSVFAPGAIVTLSGQRLTSGSSLSAAETPLPVRLAGTHVEVNGESAPLFSVAPDAVLARLPSDLAVGTDASLTISSVNRAAGSILLHIDAAAPGIIGVNRVGDVLSIYATGLGATDPSVDVAAQSPSTPLAVTRAQASVLVQNQPATVQFSGLAPGLVGIYQINAVLPPGLGGAADVVVESDGNASNPFHVGL